MSSTPTPLDDNRANLNDERMYNAIDNVMSQSEQTYEDFMKGFTYLKTKDLESKQKTDKDKLQKSQEGGTKSAVEIPEQSEAGDKEELKNLDRSEDDTEIQEEVLEPGVVCGRMSQAGSQSGTVQFDNFIEDQSGDEDSDLENISSGYTASFTASVPGKSKALVQDPSKQPQAEKDTESGSKSKETDSELKNQAVAEADTHDNEEDDSDTGNTEDILGAQASIDAMKNILLENFLSDFCEEMGLEGVTGMEFDETADMIFDESDENEQTDDVTFDGDPLELLLGISDFGGPNMKEYVKDSISKIEESKSVPKSKEKSNRKNMKGKVTENSGQNMRNKEDPIKATIKSEEDAKISSQNGTESKQPNSEASVSSSVAKDKCEILEDNEEQFSGKLLYPGEVDSDEAASGITTETRLEFKATYRESQDKNLTKQDCSNEVESFTLDEDFDYDNVVLTPKYSAEDMERLSALMAGKVTL